MFRRTFAIFLLPAFIITGSLVSGCAVDGRAVFEREGCLGCHRFRGRGGYLGPDLTAVGARRSAAWIEQQLKDPKKNSRTSRMPAYDNLSSREIRAIVRYLQSEE